MTTTVRQRVVAAAHHAGLRLADLARFLAIQAPSLHSALGRNSPTCRHLGAIAQRCDVAVEWLRTGDQTQVPAWLLTADVATSLSAALDAPTATAIPAHLLQRIRLLEEEKATLSCERDEALAQVAAVVAENKDLRDAITVQAIRLAKLHALRGPTDLNHAV